MTGLLLCDMNEAVRHVYMRSRTWDGNLSDRCHLGLLTFTPV